MEGYIIKQLYRTLVEQEDRYNVLSRWFTIYAMNAQRQKLAKVETTIINSANDKSHKRKNDDHG